MLRSLLASRIVHALGYNQLTRYLLLYPCFWVGYLFFLCTGRTPWVVYVVFLLLHEQTEGRFTRWLAEAIKRRRPLLDFSAADGVLGNGPELEEELDRAAANLREQGYHVFLTRLPSALLDELVEFATRQPATLRPSQEGCPARLVFDRHEPKAPTYRFDESHLVSLPAVQVLVGDTSLMSLAQDYFEVAPINDLLAMWWSTPWGQQASSEAAQLFHFDVDRIRFLKIFFYLTDVGPENGPHVFVRGTHGPRRAPFYEARRFSDEEIASAYPVGDIVAITGPAGTIVAVDTSGLHKGELPRSGCRLIFQMEFATSLFAQEYNCLQVPESAVAEFRRRMNLYPPVFERFSVGPEARTAASSEAQRTETVARP
jgi:hypothetical protein